ncbi:TetR/AcrR family transcriptional regulator [Tritonibacter aquimaris]|nr:TetR/AcrR family transcriptional regulator [Tritonibacter aquimaris]
MARSRVFDEETAVDRAMQLFWRNGYEATSITDLTTAMGINKGSLYHSFGSKHDLFMRVLLRYSIECMRATLQRVGQNPDPIAAIDDLFAQMIRQSLADTDRKGCFLVNTALDLQLHSAEVQDMTRRGLAEYEGFFAEKLTAAKSQGRLSDTFDVDEAASALMALETGLQVMARGMYSEKKLQAIRHQAQRLVRD